MNSRQHTRTLARFVLAGCLVVTAVPGCSSTGDADGTENIPDIEVHVPTQAEADAAAAQRITAKNADAEYRKLLDEIDAESESEDED